MLTIDCNKTSHFSAQEIIDFKKDGVVYLKSFYDLENDILPIKKDIYKIISLIIIENNILIKQPPFSPFNFDAGLNILIKNHRELAGILYDALKKLPSYVRLANTQKHENLIKILLESDFIGFANRGYGIRMDHPNEDEFLTQWHQDYVSQLCSAKGLVLWSPLRDVTLDMGPVEYCIGSHREGVFPIVREGTGSYGLKIYNEEKIVSQYKSLTPLVKTGDLLIMDYMTLHRSSRNISQFTRWAMISRYFDFLEKTGISYGWKGGLQEGNSFEKVHPELAQVIN